MQSARITKGILTPFCGFVVDEQVGTCIMDGDAVPRILTLIVADIVARL
jgi:hypothetical protein